MRPSLLPGEDADWLLHHDGVDLREEAGIESRFAIGNGLLGVRAARAVSRGPTWVAWQHALSWASWPRTYVAGLFDTPNTDPPVPALVPVGDWLRVRILLDGEQLRLCRGTLLAHRRSLDLRRGKLLAAWRQRTPAGAVAEVRSLRLVSQHDRALGLQLLELELDRDGIAVSLQADCEAAGLGLAPVRLTRALGIWRTGEGGHTLAMASTATLTRDGKAQPPDATGTLRHTRHWRSVAGQTAGLTRLLAVARGDAPADRPGRTAAALRRGCAAGAEGVLAAHEAAWAARWQASDITIDGDPDLERALRFAVYHLNSAANPQDDRVSIGARGLTGDAYLGHVFWDTEIYLLPFYIATWPEAARALLMYRFHTLDGARAKAARGGWRGALYAWESADTGAEATPEQVIGPAGTPVDVLSGRQEHHIAADVAYAVWQYWRATGDDAFLLEAGAEILLETARFWASRATPDADGRRHIRGVIGPDEYHEGVDDSAYTNTMARWNLLRALELWSLLGRRWPLRRDELAGRLALAPAEPAHWAEVAATLVTGHDPQTGLIEQFAGFFALEPVDLARYADRSVPMDVLLGHARIQRTQVVKQADVVALLALLPEAFDAATHLASFRAYEPRCAHGSSLSRSMHALVAARLGEQALALRYLHETATTDLAPGAADSAGGVHIAALGGLWQAVVLGFAGLSLDGEELALNPRLPPHWRGLAFRVCWRGRRVRLHISPGGAVQATLEAGEPMTLKLHGADLALAAPPR